MPTGHRRALSYAGAVLVLGVAVVVIGTWFGLSRLQAARERTAVTPGGGKRSGWGRMVAVGVAAVAVVAVLVQGCEGSEGPSGGPGRAPGEPCIAYREEDCSGRASSTTAAERDERRREPCPAYRAEDCPLAPATATLPTTTVLALGADNADGADDVDSGSPTVAHSGVMATARSGARLRPGQPEFGWSPH